MSEPYRVLEAVLYALAPGDYLTAETWHEQAAHAGLKSHEKARAHQEAIDAGYLERVIVHVGGRTAAVQVPSQVPSRKGGGVQLHRRTDKPLPGQDAPLEG